MRWRKNYIWVSEFLKLRKGQIFIQFLELFVFDEHSDHQDYGMQVLEEYWISGALYRDF